MQVLTKVFLIIGAIDMLLLANNTYHSLLAMTAVKNHFILFKS